MRLSLSNRRNTAPALRASLYTSFGINLFTSTVKRRLREAGLNGCDVRHKPLHTDDHKKRRLQYAKEHLSWTGEMSSKVLCIRVMVGCAFTAELAKNISMLLWYDSEAWWWSQVVASWYGGV